MRYNGKFINNKKEKPKNKTGRIVLIAFLILLLLIGVVFAWGISYYNRMFHKMNVVTLDQNLYETYDSSEQSQDSSGGILDSIISPEKMDIPEDDIINILVVGQASREGEESRMADTTILVTVNTYDGTITLSSVLRDAFVALPAYKSHTAGRNKFNVCYNLGYSWEGIEGAMAFTNLTMYHNFGVKVDHNIEISFESFTKLIDYIGGVEIELTEAEADYLNKDDLYVLYDVKPGVQYLDGMAALSYARMRKAAGDGDSDINRTARQRKLIEVLVNKFRGLSLKEMQGVADTLLPLVTTTMTPKDVTSILLRMLRHASDFKVESGTIPVNTTYWGEMVDIYGDGGSHSVLKFDAEQNKRLIRAFTELAPAE